MRNRYLVVVATALMAVLLVNATGCKSNPEKARQLVAKAIPNVTDYVRSVPEFRALQRQLMSE